MTNVYLVQAVYHNTWPTHIDTIGIYEDYNDAIRRRDYVRVNPNLFPAYDARDIEVDVFTRPLHTRGDQS